MEKSIDLTDSVYQLIKEYPELKAVMSDLGFKDILLPGMLETAGRVMTLKKGASLKKIPLETIENTLKEMGFTLKGGTE